MPMTKRDREALDECRAKYPSKRAAATVETDPVPADPAGRAERLRRRAIERAPFSVAGR